MKENIQSRLIRFASLCISVKKHLNHTYESDHLGKQLVRSSTSAALNYGESRSAESKKDFVHKQSICLKELRESYINLLIVDENSLCRNEALGQQAIDEANQLVSIFVVSVKTAMQKDKAI